ncbi:hypothetical protein TNCV_365761 [Trichonephila clavipes]|nr:hypothetical protein TNCV_365761 [Trichonephila clavipes]
MSVCQSDCRHQPIWRESGTAFIVQKISRKSDRYPTCSIMVWAGIMINGRTRLHVVVYGTMMGQRYTDEVSTSSCSSFSVVLPVINLFLWTTTQHVIEHSRCSGLSQDSEGLQRLVWPVRSQDLNPIEKAVDALRRQVAGRNYPPTNKNTSHPCTHRGMG